MAKAILARAGLVVVTSRRESEGQFDSATDSRFESDPVSQVSLCILRVSVYLTRRVHVFLRGIEVEMIVWIISDDHYDAEAIKEIVFEQCPDAVIRIFQSIFDTGRAGSVDLVIIDISSVCPITLLHTAYSPICTLLDLHPGVSVIIASAISKNAAEDVRTDILEHIPDANIRIAGFPMFETIRQC